MDTALPPKVKEVIDPTGQCKYYDVRSEVSRTKERGRV